MYKKFTIFRQITQLISRYDFQKAVKAHDGEKNSKGFSCWSQFIAMLFGQLSGQDGLRGIENGLLAHANDLYHLGIQKVKRSTLAYANKCRSSKVYETLFGTLLSKVTALAPRHKFRFKGEMFSMDSTTIDLSLELYDWAKFRTTKGGIKLHTRLNHSGYIPDFIHLTDAKVHDINIARRIRFKKGDVVVMDRAYNDYKLFANYCEQGTYFVTRLKRNAKFKIVERRDVSKYKNVSSDHVIAFTGVNSSKKCPLHLRKIRVKDPETGKCITLLTNNMKWSPATLAAIYKNRWQIEIFFKTIKQNLKVKSFVGTSRNAVMTQVWIAAIAYLLLSFLKFQSKQSWTIYKLMSVLPSMLFAKTGLWDWLDSPPTGEGRRKIDELQLQLL